MRLVKEIDVLEEKIRKMNSFGYKVWNPMDTIYPDEERLQTQTKVETILSEFG